VKFEKTDEIAAYKVNRHWLYAPSTYLLDSWEAVVEEIYLPEGASKSGELSFKFIAEGRAGTEHSPSIKSKVKQVFSEKAKDVLVSESRVIVDLRVHSPENLAHAITNHLPVALLAKEYLKEINQPEPLLLLPSALPNYIEQLFSSVGFQLLLTDAVVIGKVCEFKVEPWIAIRGIRHTVFQENLSGSGFAESLYTKSLSLPKRIFISRRDTRCISNEHEVERFLTAKGYQKIYLEDYDILEQIAMVSLADSIVAIHGAALGPLILRVLFDTQPLKLVELFSPGHMTNVFRMVSQQIGGEWVGVRGKLWPAIIKQAYICLPENVRKYSLVKFDVCLLSLEKAMESIEL